VGLSDRGVRYDLPLMPVRPTGRIVSRDAHPFPGTQEYRQTWRVVILQGTSLLGLWLLSVYRLGDRTGVGFKRRERWIPLGWIVYQAKPEGEAVGSIMPLTNVSPKRIATTAVDSSIPALVLTT